MTTGFELLGLEHGVIPSDMWAVGALQSAPNGMKLDMPVLLQHCEDRAHAKRKVQSSGLCMYQLNSCVVVSIVVQSVRAKLSVSSSGLAWQVVLALWFRSLLRSVLYIIAQVSLFVVADQSL